MEKATYQTSWIKIIGVFFAFLGVILLVDPLLPKDLGKIGGLITQEAIIIFIVLTLNHFWIHQPLHFKPAVSFRTILGVNLLPVLFVITAVILTFSGNNIHNFTTALIVGICAGITEELTFRGIILPGILTHFEGHRGIWIAVLISSVLFGSAHMVNLARQPLEATLLQGTNALAIGLVLAAIYLRTSSLIFPMILHGVNDYISTIAAHGNITMHNQSFAPFIGQWIIYLLLALFLLRKSKTKEVYKITEK